MTNQIGFICKCCGEFHEELPTSFSSDAPIYYESASPEEREERFELDDDLCVMDDEHYFIRGCIEIPIINTEEYLIWGVWVSLSEINFNKTVENWDKQETLEPMYGWLSTELPFYPETLNLKARVNFRADGFRPFIELEPTDHPLSIESMNGVSLERVEAIASEILCVNREK